MKALEKRRNVLIFAVILISLMQCSPDTILYGSAEDYRLPDTAIYGTTHSKIVFDSLELWERHPENPVYRDEVPGYEVAADAHVFIAPDNILRMIYTGDYDGHTSIIMARGTAFDTWNRTGLLLSGGAVPSGETSGKETPFYFYNEASGKHQIYYIAYSDEDPDTAYESEIYMAEADDIEGAYSVSAEPVIPNGSLAGEDVHMMTSPSVVEYDDRLYLTFIAWNAPPNKTTMVWMMGAVSSDSGASWGAVQKVEAPIGMEGQITKGPDGLFYAVSTRDYENTEAIFLSRAESPFGSYSEGFAEPVIVKTGSPLEADELIAPQLTFNPVDKRAFLFYTGADYSRGYWAMAASAEYDVE